MYKKTVRNQMTLYPRTIDEIIPEDHMCRFIIKIVDRLDTHEIDNKYSSLGQNAYDPKMMLSLLFYSYIHKIFSSRKIEQQCKENVCFIYICAEKAPDFRTISDFRKNNLHLLQQYFIQVVLLAKKANLVEFKEIAIDGTKIKANAASRKTKNKEQFQKTINGAEKFVAEMLEKASETNDEKVIEECTRNAKQTKARIKRMKEAIAQMEANPEQKKINLTDADCTLQKGVGAGYNAQLAVDTTTRLALGGDVVTNRNDTSQLLPMIDQVEKNTVTEEQPKTILADTGYASAKVFEVLEEKPHIDAYVPPRKPESNSGRSKGKFNKSKFVFDKEKQTYICPNKQPMLRRNHGYKANGQGYTRYLGTECCKCSLKAKCTNAPKRCISVYDNEYLVEAMRVKTATEAGKKATKRRSQTVEPVFGVIKECKNFRKFHLRGLEKVRGEWMLMLISYNISKLHALMMGKYGNNRLIFTKMLSFRTWNQIFSLIHADIIAIIQKFNYFLKTNGIDLRFHAI